jgi:hypothetical protein
VTLAQFIKKDLLQCEKVFIDNNVDGAKLIKLSTIDDLRNIGITDSHVAAVLLKEILILKSRVHKGFKINYNYLNS